MNEHTTQWLVVPMSSVLFDSARLISSVIFRASMVSSVRLEAAWTFWTAVVNLLWSSFCKVVSRYTFNFERIEDSSEADVSKTCFYSACLRDRSLVCSLRPTFCASSFFNWVCASWRARCTFCKFCSLLYLRISSRDVISFCKSKDFTQRETTNTLVTLSLVIPIYQSTYSGLPVGQVLVNVFGTLLSSCVDLENCFVFIQVVVGWLLICTLLLSTHFYDLLIN